jgi:hypothetical protein
MIDVNSTIGFDVQADRSRYEVTAGGVVAVPKGRTDFFARCSRNAVRVTMHRGARINIDIFSVTVVQPARSG